MLLNIDSNLALQLLVVIASSIAFIFILEAFGFIGLGLVKIVARTFNQEEMEDREFLFVLRTFVGGLFYTLVFFSLGVFGLITKQSVLVISIATPVAAFFIGRRWRGLSWGRILPFFRTEKWVLLGALTLLLATFVLWFRPITGFDGLWYHLTIPKLFLQRNNIFDQGGLILYSLQPSLDYFWNLWPLSLPVSTAIAGIAVNTIQALSLAISLIFAGQVGARVFKWGKFAQFSAPILIGGTYETFRILGIGGNDILGLAYGITSAIFCFYILQKSKISWNNFIIGVLLIVGLASIKIFFSILAFLLLIYLVFESWNGLPFSSNHKKRLLALSGILVILFIVTYLPWILRSYFSTGRLLDPIGQPEINARSYLEAGGTALNHWTNFVFERFYSSVIPILTFVYSPLVILGLASIFNKNIRSKISSIWLIAISGFILTFFISISLQWRYYLPTATLVIFLGTVVLFSFIETGGFSRFFKIALTGFAALFIVLTILRVIITPSDKTGLPNINRDIYIYHFSSTGDYLSTKLSGSIYDYVQETSPKDLNPEEKIFIGNGSDLTLHNLAYVKNPFLENNTDKKEFSSVKTFYQLKDWLLKENVRYIIVRNHKMSDICKEIGIEDYKACDNQDSFKFVLHDKKWNIDWYQMLRI